MIIIKKGVVLGITIIVILIILLALIPNIYNFLLLKSYHLNIVSSKEEIIVDKDNFTSILGSVKLKNDRKLIDTQFDFNGYGLYCLKNECYQIKQHNIPGNKYAFLDNNGECFAFLIITNTDFFWSGGRKVNNLYIRNNFIFPNHQADPIKTLILHETSCDPPSIYLKSINFTNKDIIIDDSNKIAHIISSKEYEQLAQDFKLDSNGKYIVLAEFENNPIYEVLAVL